jgi:uncharacterized protein
VESRLRALEATHAITLLRPFHGHGQKELTKTPKVYGFDTGFVSFMRGWHPLRPDDYGVLWEHPVLKHLQAHEWRWPVHYWRDSAGREVDFVIPYGRDRVNAIECKWNPVHLDPAAIKPFRSYYPKGRNYLITPRSAPSYERSVSGLRFIVCNPGGWRQYNAATPPHGSG